MQLWRVNRPPRWFRKSAARLALDANAGRVRSEVGRDGVAAERPQRHLPLLPALPEHPDVLRPRGPRRRRRARPARRSVSPAPYKTSRIASIPQPDERRRCPVPPGVARRRRPSADAGATAEASVARRRPPDRDRSPLHEAGTGGTSGPTRACGRPIERCTDVRRPPRRRGDGGDERADDRLVDGRCIHDVALLAERHVASEIAPVRGERVHRQAAFDGEMVEVPLGPHDERVPHRDWPAAQPRPSTSEARGVIGSPCASATPAVRHPPVVDVHPERQRGVAADRVLQPVGSRSRARTGSSRW